MIYAFLIEYINQLILNINKACYLLNCQSYLTKNDDLKSLLIMITIINSQNCVIL